MDPTHFFYTLNLEPRPQLRHRHTKAGRTYDHPRSRKDKQAIRDEVEAALRSRGLPIPLFREGPLMLDLEFWFELPKSDHRKRDPVGRQHHVKHRFDLDNMMKLFCDAVNGVLWGDDGQVGWVHMRKAIEAQGEGARVVFGVQPIKGDADWSIFDAPF